MGLSSDDLGFIDASRELEIVTRSGPREYRTVVWAVVDDEDVFVRSFLGEEGAWYQRVLTNPDVDLRVADRSIPLRATHARDNASVACASQAFRRKYTKGANLDAMLRDEVLSTTLRLQPRGDA